DVNEPHFWSDSSLWRNHRGNNLQCSAQSQDGIVAPQVEELVTVPRNSHDIEISIAVQIHNKSAKVILTTSRNDVLNPGSPVAHILPDLQPLCAAVLGRDDVRTAVVVHIANVRAVGGELCGQLMAHPVRAD